MKSIYLLMAENIAKRSKHSWQKIINIWKQWQTTPKNLPRMQCTRAIPVAWLGSGSCPNWPKGWILIINNKIMICYIFHAFHLTSNNIKEIQMSSQVTCLQILLVHFLPTGYYRNPSESDNDDQMEGKMGWWDIRQYRILVMKMLNPADQALQVTLCVDAHDQCHSPAAMSWTDCPALSQFLQLELILQTLLLLGSLCWFFALVLLACCFP